MNKHVPPPADEKARTAGSGAPADAGVKERPARAPEAKSPQPAPQAEPRQPIKPQSDARPNDDGQGQPQDPELPREEINPLRAGFWTRQRLGIAGMVIAALVVLLLWSPWSASEPKVAYRFTPAAYGNVALTVTANAIVEPRDAAEVVAQTGGRVGSVLVKSGDPVVKGQPLVHLVSEYARDELIAAQAELASRQSDLARSEADLKEARAAVARQRNDPKPGALDAAEARLARVVVNTDQSRALLRDGEASVAAARTAVENLNIRAPTAGVVLKTNVIPQQPGVRAITRGQSVVTLAGDLSQVNLRTDFPESALGSLRLGARADFTAPAFPRRTFAATLTALDIWPKREARDGRQFVTYGGVLTAPNPGSVLRPGMSANVAVIVAEAKNVLLVPNAALAFVPPPKVEAQFPPNSPAAHAGTRLGRVWVLQGTSPYPRDVTLGLSDGRVTAITGGSLRAGEKLITGALIPAGA